MYYVVRCIAFLLMLPLLAQAQDQSEQIYFYSEASPPYYFIDDNGQAKGINVDIANALIELLKLDASIEYMPWARAYSTLVNQPNIVLVSVLRTEKRENEVVWLGQLHTVRASLVKLKARKDIDIYTLAQAKKHVVGSIRGYGSSDFLLARDFSESNNLMLATDAKQLWQMLFNGRIDLVLTNRVSGRYEMDRLMLDPDLTEEAFEVTGLTAELHIATGQKTSPETTKSLREGIERLKRDGTFETLLNKWELN